jgi:hypothetical protein
VAAPKTMCAACLYIENHESESLLYQIPPFFSGLLGF